MSDNMIRCDTPGSGSGPSSGSGIGHDSGLGFEEANYSAAILEKLREQRDAQRFCDVTIRIDGMNFSAHRAVLAACSPYFETLLDGSRIVRQTVVVSSHPGGHSAFSVVLQFMYTGISVLSDDIVFDVMKFSERFCMMQLRDRCIEFLQQHLTPSNCFRTKELALGLGLTGLVRIVDSYIVANAVEISDAQSIVELSYTHLEELIGRSMPLSEIARVRLISRWVEYKEERRIRMPALMAAYVQWQKVGPMELCTFLRGCVEELSYSTALPSDWCLYRVLQSLKDSCLLPDIYFDQLGRLRDNFSADECRQLTGASDSLGAGETDDNDVAVDVDVTAADEEQESVLQSSADVAEKLASSPVSHEQNVEPENALESAVNAERLVASDMSLLRQQDSCSSNQEQETTRTRRKRVPGQYCSRKQHSPSVDAAVSIADTSGQQGGEDSNSELASHEPSHSDNSERNQRQSKTCKSAKKSVKKRQTIGLRKIRCHECQFKAQTVDKLRNHVRTAHRDRQTFFCSVCSFKTHWNREYYKHMTTHFSGPPYHCDSCTFTADRIRPLVIHRMDHTDSRPYCCRTCGIRFKMRNNLAAHERCHSGICADMSYRYGLFWLLKKYL